MTKGSNEHQLSWSHQARAAELSYSRQRTSTLRHCEEKKTPVIFNTGGLCGGLLILCSKNQHKTALFRSPILLTLHQQHCLIPGIWAGDDCKAIWKFLTAHHLHSSCRQLHHLHLFGGRSKAQGPHL